MATQGVSEIGKLIIVVPQGTPCGPSAGLGGTTAYLPAGHAATHEFGHLLGLRHAGLLRVTNGRSRGEEYGGHSVMGGGTTGHPPPLQVEQLRLLNAPFTKIDAATSGTYFVPPINTMTPGVKYLAVGQVTTGVVPGFSAINHVVVKHKIRFGLWAGVVSIYSGVMQEDMERVSPDWMGDLDPGKSVTIGTIRYTNLAPSQTSAYNGTHIKVEFLTEAPPPEPIPPPPPPNPPLPTGFPIDRGCWLDRTPRVLGTWLGDASSLAAGLAKCTASGKKYCGLQGGYAVWAGDGPYDIAGPVATCGPMGAGWVNHVYEMR